MMKSRAAASNFAKIPMARTIMIVTKAESSVRLSQARNMTFVILIAISTDVGSDG